MSGYLLDTSAVSLFFDGRATQAFSDWVDERNEAGEVFLSVVTIQELEKGATKLAERRGGNRQKAERIKAWIRELCLEYEDALLAIDTQTARVAGVIEGRALAGGRMPGFADVLIAATAEAHGLTVVTNNLRDFEALNVACQAPN